LDTIICKGRSGSWRGGGVVSVGLPHPDELVCLPAVSLVAEEKRILGSYMGSSAPRRDIPRLIALHAAGRLPVELLASGATPLREVNLALDRLADGHAVRQRITFP
jgi:alcohol dehydrogenase